MIYFFSSVTSIDLFSVGGVLLFVCVCVCVIICVGVSSRHKSLKNKSIFIFKTLLHPVARVGVRVIFYLFFLFFIMVIHLLSLCVELLEYISSEKKIYNFSQIKMISQKSNVLPEIHFLEDFDFLMKYNFLTQINFSQDSFSIKNINL